MKKIEALQLIRQHVKNENLVKHMVASGAIMRALAVRFGEDPGRWELTGLLHDIDWEETQEKPEMHSKYCQGYLQAVGVGDDVRQAILVHNHLHGLEPQTLMEKSLYAAEELTGLIAATALVQPSKKLADVKPDSILKKFKQPAFAAGVDRELIMRCDSLLNIELSELIQIELTAMQEIASELGL